MTTNKSYYDRGSVDLAVETPVMRKRLEKRRTLTPASAVTAERLLIVLVGLPARGKSFIARKLLNYMNWRGNQCRIFNVGKYRRLQQGQADAPEQQQKQKADFFDDTNAEAAMLRQEAAEMALKETLEWLEGYTSAGTASPTSTGGNKEDGDEYGDAVPSSDQQMSYSAARQFHRIAIFDATNSTEERRQWILQQCARADEATNAAAAASTSTTLHVHHNHHQRRRTGVLFLESICDDEELLHENFQVKISTSPDFNGMTNEQALEDLKSRIAKYEARYETIPEQSHQSYIKIFNLSSRLTVNHVYGRLAKVVLPAIMAWNTGTRPIYLIRAGETEAMEAYNNKDKDKEAVNEEGNTYLEAFVHNRTQHRKRSDRLGARGRRFRDAVCNFIEKEGNEFMQRKNDAVMHPSTMDTGTSIAGLREEIDHSFEHEPCLSYDDDDSEECDDAAENGHDPHPHLPFPCLLMSSTMPRAIETATWTKHPFPIKDVANLNPLDMGDFTGMDLTTIREQHPVWYEQLRRDPFYTRFPGGESYGDLIDRLYSIIIDMEQQLGLAVAISHVSVLQVLVSYFRSTPIHKCMDAEVHMHTVYKFVPLRGGGWLESQHVLLPDGEDAVLEESPISSLRRTIDGREEGMPIWGDSSSCLPPVLDSR